MLRLLDALVFSGVWVAIAAASLAVAASRGLGAPADARVAALAFAGTFAVYGVDRLRDRARDAAQVPVRSAFVERHRATLVAAVAFATAVVAGSALALGPAVIALAAAAGAIGLLHRRLKERILFKAGYVALVWVLVVACVPAAVAGASASATAWVAAVLGLALLANAIAFNVRDREAFAARIGRRRALALARGWALLGVVVAALAPPPVRPLGVVALATLVSLLGFRGDERYAHVAVDGALIAGAAAAIAIS